MVFRELQTSAAYIVHLPHLTAGEAKLLQDRFGYHPHDVEQAINAQLTANFCTYGKYAYLSLIWPSLKQSALFPIQIFIDEKRFTIIGDVDHQISGWLDQLSQSADDPQWQSSAPELMIAMWRMLIKDIVNHPQRSAVGSRLMESLTTSWLSSDAVVLRQCAHWLRLMTDDSTVASLVILSHQLDCYQEQSAKPVAAAAVNNGDQPVVIPKLLTTYALASAVMVLTVIIFMARL